MADAAKTFVDERVQDAVARVVEAHRPELERLVRDRVDLVISELADRLVQEQLSRRCLTCGGTPTLPQRRFCADCHRSRSRELHQIRRARRNGRTSADDEEPEPVQPRDARAYELMQGADASVRTVSEAREQAAGISAAELLARSGNGNGRPDLSPRDLERWLLDGQLAERSADGLLTLTRHGWEIGSALTLR